MSEFEHFFREASRSLDRPEGSSPYPYQTRLATKPWPQTLVVPTGFGKTAAVLSAWLCKRARRDPDTPGRLVYCLPMRTLVEQTARVAEHWRDVAKTVLSLEVYVHTLMGGAERHGRRGVPQWIMQADKPTILIGTQDMLVSAALMRGYGVSRYRWPVDFALLNNGAFWVFDEVQLAGATLPTSAQMEAFRGRLGVAVPTRTMWMSATLDPAWLQTVDFTPSDAAPPHDLRPEDLAQAADLWNARKALAKAVVPAGRIAAKPGPARDKGVSAYAAEVAALARKHARPGGRAIVFLNTVARAQAVHAALRQGSGLEPLLLHSRFRPVEREKITEAALSPPPASGRIVVTTQALEAGVDMTSSVLITELAPWSSLVQRFGRCNRYGECGETGGEGLWIDLPDEAARPYTPEALADARAKLAELAACGPATLSVVKPSPPAPTAVIRRRDLMDLFDTEADLSGFDLDVSMYVRETDDTDVRLFWRDVANDQAPPPDAPAAARGELCPAPVGGARELLKRTEVRAWRWDTLDRSWTKLAAAELTPGMTVLIDARCGGYDETLGFDPASTQAVRPVIPAGEPPRAMDDDVDSESRAHVSLARHSAHIRDKAKTLCKELGVVGAEREAVLEAALWHDLGKAHPAFVASTRRGAPADAPPTPLLAKWPKAPKGTPRHKGERRHFRHELASALGFLADRGWAREADLAAYLIAAHHGKVRMRLRALPGETGPADGLFARGVWDGDTLPATWLAEIETPALTLDLDLMQLGDGEHGPSWSARTEALLTVWGPFRLAWLEALVRIADWRASNAEDEAGVDDF